MTHCLEPAGEIDHVLNVARRCLKKLEAESPTMFEQIRDVPSLLFRAWIAAHEEQSRKYFEVGLALPGAHEALALAEKPEWAAYSAHWPVAMEPEVFVRVAGHTFPVAGRDRYVLPLWAAVLRKVFR